MTTLPTAATTERCALDQLAARIRAYNRGDVVAPPSRLDLARFLDLVDALRAAVPTPEERKSIEHYARYAADKAYTVRAAGYPKLAKPFLSHAVHLRNYLTRTGGATDGE